MGGKRCLNENLDLEEFFSHLKTLVNLNDGAKNQQGLSETHSRASDFHFLVLSSLAYS